MIFIASSVMLVSCKEEEEVQEPKKTKENYHSAENNSEIITEKVWGVKESSIHETIVINNEIYAMGVKGGQETLSKISASGQELWSNPIDIDARSILEVDDNRFIVVGKKGSKGAIRLYNLKGELLYASNDFVEGADLFFTAISKVSNESFIVGGTSIKNKKRTPYLREITINDKNEIKVNDKIIFDEFEDCAIQSVKYLGDFEFIISMNRYLGDEKKGIVIFRTAFEVSGTGGSTPIAQNNEMPYSYRRNTEAVVLWDKEILSDTNLPSYTNQGNKTLVVSDNKIFVIGSTYDLKEPTPSSGSYWSSGFIFCLDFDGNIQWKKTISLSNKDERLYTGIYHKGNLFVVGKHSSYVLTPSEESFSNGLLAKISENGNVLYTKTFGDKTNAQGFNTFEIVNEKLLLFGYANDRKDEYKKWFVKLSLN